jgi:NAD(P)-dependent dehydrogenase (short-subunit alcohol dehydrogenase family)
MQKMSEGPNRRGFLRTAGLVGAGAAAIGVSAEPGIASASVSETSGDGGSARWNPDPESSQFTLAVMPDTQFMYWGTQGSVNPEPQEASFRYIVGNSGDESGNNIVFMAHLGDLTEDADASSFARVGQAFDILDSHEVAYSVLAGNHDVSGTDQRGSTPYLQTLGPRRLKNSPTFAGSDATGYNTAHIFRAAGRDWLLLALDWRMSSGGFDWANQFIKANPKLPVIVTTHEIVGSLYDDNVYPYQPGDPDNDAAFSGYGQQVWDTLMNVTGQIAVTQAFLPLLRRARGRIVMIGSIGDRTAMPFGEPLGASKAAIASIAEALRQELAPWDIKVILIEPASIRTEAVDKFAADAEKTIASFTDSGRALYAASYRRMADAALPRLRRGSPPSVVADTIAAAVAARRPRARYLVGKDARRIAALSAFLPAPVFDAIRRRLFNLPAPGSRAAHPV